MATAAAPWPVGNFAGSPFEPPRKSPHWQYQRIGWVPWHSRMRDIFEDLFVRQPTDPVAAARRAMRSPLRRRFYQAVHVADAEDGCAILLDDAPVRTPGR